MYVNLHALPAGKAMYTLCVAVRAERAVDPDEFSYDEFDIVADRYASAAAVIRSAQANEEFTSLYDLDDIHEVVGVVDQSAGEVVWQVAR